ncbi:UNVERIFIED_CONTAM: hypothetical protein DES50_1238 [Williamsia faeni]
MTDPLPLEVRIDRLLQLAKCVKQPATSQEVSEGVTATLGRPVPPDAVDQWFAGEVVPTEAERQAIAEVCGFGGDSSAYIASDDPNKYVPIHQQIGNLLELAHNTTGLVALRASAKPMTDHARQALADLARRAHDEQK